MHYGAKQESVARVAREHDPAYGGSVSAVWFTVRLLHVARSSMVALLCSSGPLCLQKPSELGRSFKLGRSRPLVVGLSGCPYMCRWLQEPAARQELLTQAAAIKAARRGPRATDIGLGLPGGWGEHWLATEVGLVGNSTNRAALPRRFCCIPAYVLPSSHPLPKPQTRTVGRSSRRRTSRTRSWTASRTRSRGCTPWRG